MSASPAEPLGTWIQLRWADTDAYGHVNNVTWVRYLEEARIRLYGLPDHPGTADPEHPPVLRALDPGCFTVTAAQRLEYVRELTYHGQSIWVEAWISRLGSSSLDLSFRALDEHRRDVHLLAETTQVVRDRATRGPHRFTEREVAALSPYLAPPNTFR